MKRIRTAVIVLLVLVIISAGIWWGIRSASTAVSNEISTSGFIEADSFDVAFETGGRITVIAAKEGDQIKAGVTLAKLDDSILKSQQQQVEANLQLAQASVEQALVSQEGAKTTWEDAVTQRTNNIARAQAQVASLREILADLEKGINFQGQTSNFDRLANVLSMRSQLVQAELNLQLVTTNVTVDQAYTVYQSAIAAVNTAKKQVEQVQASAKVIETQLGLLAVSSPVPGVVSAKNASVGEVAKPGAPVLTIIELDKVTLTAYVPESKIGLVKLGQNVAVSVDSYPGTNFPGTVTYISPQAQFTPRNVQLKEEREKTVFAIKISLDNPEHKLKPGMPADAWLTPGS